MRLLFIGNDIKQLESLGFKDDETIVYPRHMSKENIFVKSQQTYQLGHKCQFGLLCTRRTEGHRSFVNHDIDEVTAKELLETNLFREVNDEEMKTYAYRH